MKINEFDSLIYGLIQGVTEFIPVSSSGHLALLPGFLNIEDPGVFFDLCMHVGTALAVGIYFREDLIKLIKDTLNMAIFKKEKVVEKNYTINFWVSTVTTMVLGLFLKGFSEKFGRFENLIAINLLLFGVLMFIADYWMPKKKTNYMWENKSYLYSFLIGLFQAFAVFPGVSRSGGTLTISRFLKLGREEAARYSFLLSLPIIGGGMILKICELRNSPLAFDLLPLLIGTLVSFVSGYLTIHYFLKFISKVGLVPFVIYRVLFGVFILLK